MTVTNVSNKQEQIERTNHMAKVTKSAVAPSPAAETTGTTAPAVAPKSKGPKEPNGADIFKRVFVDGKASPLTHKNAKGEIVPCNTPQVKVIANLLEAIGPDGCTRKELCEKLPAAGLVTRQPVGRIVSYYQKPMVDAGMIVIVKGAAPVAPADEAPAAQ